jgi:hypothetical protein
MHNLRRRELVEIRPPLDHTRPPAGGQPDAGAGNGAEAEDTVADATVRARAATAWFGADPIQTTHQEWGQQQQQQ